MPEERIWTIARYPNGTWSTDGRPDDPDYEGCEIFQITAVSRDQAKNARTGSTLKLNGKSS